MRGERMIEVCIVRRLACFNSYGSASSMASTDSLSAETNASGADNACSVSWNSDTSTPSLSTTIKRYPCFTMTPFRGRPVPFPATREPEEGEGLSYKEAGRDAMRLASRRKCRFSSVIAVRITYRSRLILTFNRKDVSLEYN